jgi:hypothetical protein
MKRHLPLLVGLIALAVALLAAPHRPADARPEPLRAQTVTVYEWGAQTASWDGSPEVNIPFSVPGFYHKAPDAATPDPVDSPVPIRPGPPRPVRKPVVYFESADPIQLNVTVTFADGNLTWLFPKPTVAQPHTAAWRNLQIRPAPQGEDPPRGMSLGKVAEDHWGAFSREGSTSYVIHGDECERFLFYEGDNRALPELDVYRNQDGEIVIANRTGHPVHDVRFHQTTEEGTKGWYIMRVGAESSVVLDPKAALDWEEFSKAGRLTAETRDAGLTQAQARVFERAWQDLFFRTDLPGLSWRRDRGHLDALMRLDVRGGHLNPNITVDTRRVGYMFIHGVDLERQDEFTGLIDDALAGNEEAAEKLRTSGPAGVTALRRVVADDTNPKVFRDAAEGLLSRAGR